jgi:hypothetical protein
MNLGQGRAAERLWDAVEREPRTALEAGLSPTDLQTLLLAMAKARATAVTPARVAGRWREDAFVRPSGVDARVLCALEAELWKRLPGEFDALELSPVAPFGACAAVAGTDQNRVLTTTRTSELVADQTVVLALEAARRRAKGDVDVVRLAATHRVLRAQRFPDGYQQHFRLLALVSSARDAGSGRTDASLLLEHLRFYVGALSELFPGDSVQIRLTSLGSPVVWERVTDWVLPQLDPLPGNVTVSEDPDRTHGRGYYRDLAMRIDLVRGGSEIEIGDGGFTDWTSRLMSDGKERCLTTCISTERLAEL